MHNNLCYSGCGSSDCNAYSVQAQAASSEQRLWMEAAYARVAAALVLLALLLLLPRMPLVLRVQQSYH